MSMVGHYRRIPPTELLTLQSDPSGIADFLYGTDVEALPKDRCLDIDKTWHAIHFLLCGDTWEGQAPLGNAVLGGTPLGDVNIGYGPARYLTAAEVEGVADALEEIHAADLLERYDADALNEAGIYPQGWSDRDEDRDYIRTYYLDLVVFFRKAAKSHEAVLAYIG